MRTISCYLVMFTSQNSITLREWLTTVTALRNWANNRVWLFLLQCWHSPSTPPPPLHAYKHMWKPGTHHELYYCIQAYSCLWCCYLLSRFTSFLSLCWRVSRIALVRIVPWKPRTVWEIHVEIALKYNFFLELSVSVCLIPTQGRYSSCGFIQKAERNNTKLFMLFITFHSLKIVSYPISCPTEYKSLNTYTLSSQSLLIEFNQKWHK
jgi:hypothetical protein